NYKSDEDDKHERVTEVSIAIDRPSEKFKKALDFGAALAEATVRARDMINTPANYMTPSHLIVEAKRIAKTAGLSCTVYDKKRMADEKMECILSVAKGSEEPPALIILEYCPKKKPKKHVVLVGKGVTFDAGGISLKPPQGMPTMKDDMAGAAAVIAAMSTIGNFKPGIKVTAIIPAVENLPDGKALKPGDIIRAKNGKTIEIITTDAEGRLILADALVLASEMKPSAIVDLATLTGGALYCCGELYSLIMGNDERLIAKMMAAAKSSGEPMWQLPMVEEYKKGYTSGIADLKNSGKSKAQTIMGAIFLREFVDEKIPWAHIDIAASSWTEEKLPLSDLGGTGAMTRSLIEFVMKF
ncbi:MAG TPA: leucyl aminopeptidase family protein, partial [bacterium]|nr:leucyl aminopeptidase family protein [bacterium]